MVEAEYLKELDRIGREAISAHFLETGAADEEKHWADFMIQCVCVAMRNAAFNMKSRLTSTQIQRASDLALGAIMAMHKATAELQNRQAEKMDAIDAEVKARPHKN